MLYYLAAKFDVEALAIMTVSDSLVTGEETTAEERQTTFNEMIEVGLETALNLDSKLNENNHRNSRCITNYFLIGMNLVSSFQIA